VKEEAPVQQPSSLMTAKLKEHQQAKILVCCCSLHIQDIDIVDGSPLIDIKPYVPDFDCRKTPKIGWFSSKISKLATTRDDGRFCK